MYKCYPDSKRAHLKSGGNFPYLSRSSEVNLMIQVSFLDCIHSFIYLPLIDTPNDIPRYKVLCQRPHAGESR